MQTTVNTIEVKAIQEVLRLKAAAGETFFKDIVVLNVRKVSNHTGDEYLRYILCKRHTGEYVSWGYNINDKGCYWGHYFNDHEEAILHYKNR